MTGDLARGFFVFFADSLALFFAVDQDQRGFCDVSVLPQRTFPPPPLLLGIIVGLLRRAPVLFHPIVYVSIGTIINNEVVTLESTLDDAAILFFGNLVVEITATFILSIAS